MSVLSFFSHVGSELYLGALVFFLGPFFDAGGRMMPFFDAIDSAACSE